MLLSRRPAKDNTICFLSWEHVTLPQSKSLKIMCLCLIFKKYQDHLKINIKHNKHDLMTKQTICHNNRSCNKSKIVCIALGSYQYCLILIGWYQITFSMYVGEIVVEYLIIFHKLLFIGVQQNKMNSHQLNSKCNNVKWWCVLAIHWKESSASSGLNKEMR